MESQDYNHVEQKNGYDQKVGKQNLEKLLFEVFGLKKRGPSTYFGNGHASRHHRWFLESSMERCEMGY
jgi:hypothetical protein